MQNNYYFLLQLVPALKQKLNGSVVVDSFSQNKDELILKFRSETNEFNIIAHLTGQFTCLAFPIEITKAKKNTATIFSHLIGKKVSDVAIFSNERAFCITFYDQIQLVFKLFGRQANCILFQSGNAHEIFRTRFSLDKTLVLEKLHREIDQSPESIKKIYPEYRSLFPTLNKKSVEKIEAEIHGLSTNDAISKVLSSIQQLENPDGYSIVEEGEKILFELGIYENAVKSFTDPIEAITAFYFYAIRKKNFRSEKSKLLGELDKSISKTEVYISKTQRKLSSLRDDQDYREYADLIMANMHLIKPISSETSLERFDGSSIVKIKLNPNLSAQLNAERYYKKAKNLSIELSTLEKSISSKKELLISLKDRREKISLAEDARSLKPFTKVISAKTEKSTPFKEFIIDGFMVYVGNNAKQNDLLTLKFAKKDDLFFHAKDVSGSHVILKYDSSRPFPATVLEKTAAIAAFYSKRKTDSLCPVGYTQKKYVRKPKGSPAGLVHVEREKVLLVKPQQP